MLRQRSTISHKSSQGEDDSHNIRRPPQYEDPVIKPTSPFDRRGVARFLIKYNVIFAVFLGLLLGIALQQLNLDPKYRVWFGLPGDAFLNALKSIVVPLVFITLTIATSDIVLIGKASKIGWTTAFFFLATTILASLQGACWALVYRPLLKAVDNTQVPKVSEDVKYPQIAFGCNNGKFIAVDSTSGLQSCSSEGVTPGAVFRVFDIHGLLTTLIESKLRENVPAAEPLSSQLRNLFIKIMPQNISASFANSELLSIVVFGLAFGIILASTYRVKRNIPANLRPTSTQVQIDQTGFLRALLHQLNCIITLLVRFLSQLTGIAVVSLIVKAIIGQKGDTIKILQDVGVFMAMIISATTTHVIIVQPLIFFLFTKMNPFCYMKTLLPAQVMAFGTASSIATLPTTLHCVDENPEIPRYLTRFVLSIGATINMDGLAIYFPAGIVFLKSSLSSTDMSVAEVVLLVFISAIASVGGAPLPNAGIVMLLTVWKTTHSGDVPDSFAYLVAIDWFADRFRTLANVTGDPMICRIIAEMIQDKEREATQHKLESILDVEEFEL